MDASTTTKYGPLGQHQAASGTRWRPGLRHFPWLAGISIAVLIICAASSVAIIALSDNEPVESWRFEPAVVLAVVSSIANTAMSVSFSQGAAIAWWRGAMHGATLRDLHYTWSFGRSSFQPTLRISKMMFKMALVAVIVTLAAIVNNPLLQRATRIRNGSTLAEPLMSIDLMQDPLSQAFGKVEQNVPADTFIFTNFLQSVQNWYNKTAIMTSDIPGYGCEGLCEGSISIPGLDWNCSTTTSYMNLGDTSNGGQPIFSINFTRYENSLGEVILGLDVLYSSTVDDDCTATMASQHCDISTAMVQRDIRIQNQTIKLQDNPELISRFYSSEDSIDAPDGSLAGPLSILHWLGVFYFESSFTLDFDLSDSIAFQAHGIVPAGQQYEVVNDNSTLACDATFTSPVNDILRAMEEVLFRMAYAPGLKNYAMETQTFQATQVTPTLVFHSNYRYLGIAVGVMALALLALLIPLWGWWQLGRQVGLSPLEIAKAFGAPIMKNTATAHDADGLISEIGDVRVRYGEVVSLNERSGTTVSSLEFGEYGRVRKPVKGQKFGDVSRGTVITTTEITSW